VTPQRRACLESHARWMRRKTAIVVQMSRSLGASVAMREYWRGVKAGEIERKPMAKAQIEAGRREKRG
jgi:hypothetical protein